MPQMAPISWLILFIVFSIAFMMFNVVNYFCFFNKNKLNTSNNKIIDNELNNKNFWKW